MKKAIYLVTYAVVLVIGILLLIFNYQAMNADQTYLRGVIIAGGVIFVLPAIFTLLLMLKPKRDENGNIIKRPWYSTLVAIISLIWGILMICMPEGLLGNLNITLGVSLVIVGCAGLVWVARTAPKMVFAYFVPVCCMVAGVIVMTILNNYPDNGDSAKYACIVSGVALMAWGISGFMTFRRKLE